MISNISSVFIVYYYLRGICLQIHYICLSFEGQMPSNTLYLFIICKRRMPSKQIILTKDMHVLSAYLCVIFRKVCAHFTTVETSAEQCDSVEYHR